MEADTDKCADFLSSLYQKGVRLWFDESRLHYHARRGVLTSAEISTLRLMKDEIIAVLKQRNAVVVDPCHPIVTQGSSGDLAPLTVQQEIVWKDLQRGALSFLNPFALRISGSLSADLLRSSLDAVVRRHSSLRTRIVIADGVPRQQVDEPREYVLDVVDLSDASDSEKSAAVQNVAEEIVDQGCDLALGPLFSARLLKLAAHEHLLVCGTHHIISDGFSRSLMSRQLWLSYADGVKGQPPSLQGVPIQYPDYAVWQHNTQQSWLESHGSYWRQRLAGAIAIHWPVDGRPSASLDPPKVAPISLGRSLTDDLRRVCAERGTTLGMAMLAVCVAVVSRWSGQQDFILPTAVTGRDRSVLETMFGYCAHCLYLRFQLVGEVTLDGLLGAVTQEFHRASSHQDFGRAMAVRPDLLGHTIFQWHPVRVEEYRGMPGPDIQAQLDIKVERFPLEIRLMKEDPFSKWHVWLSFGDTVEGIVGEVGARAFVFTQSAIERLAQDIHSVASGLARNPRARLMECLQHCGRSDLI